MNSEFYLISNILNNISSLILFLQNLKSLKAYFYRGGTYGDIIHESLCDDIVERLKLNILSTEELILGYLEGLNDCHVLNQVNI